MVMPSQMLPSNATSLERAIADTAPRDLLDVLADAPKWLKSSPPDAVMPWLAAEWFLSDLIGYFSDARTLIESGLPWLKLRGTAAAVKLALSWVGLSDIVLEEDGARLHIDPGRITAYAELAAIRHLVEASLPAHVLFYRLFHDYDLRALRLDRSRLDDALLDDDSGTDIDGIKISYRRRHGNAIAAQAELIAQARVRHWRLGIRYDDSQRLDNWRLDDELIRNPRIVEPARWTGTWDSRRWNSRQLPIYH